MDEAAVKRGRNNRRRGQQGERDLATRLSEEFGIKVKRNLGQERDSGHDINVPGFTIEVKRRSRVAGLYDWLKQAESGPNPTVMVRGDGQGWLAVMSLETWIKLAREEVVANRIDTPTPNELREAFESILKGK